MCTYHFPFQIAFQQHCCKANASLKKILQFEDSTLPFTVGVLALISTGLATGDRRFTAGL